MTINLILFLVLALIAIGTALGMLFSRNSVYSALFLVLNFGSVAVFYLLLGAPFIAMSQITVYAGAIMVLFLFVIMLFGAEELAPGKVLPLQKYYAGGLAIALVIEAIIVLAVRSVPAGSIVNPAESVNSMDTMRQLGGLLFSNYLLPFEMISIVLLVAMVGAITLIKQEKGRHK
jgi:NADH-quinone oxidoreductase subunit J